MKSDNKIIFFAQAGADVVHILKEIDSLNEGAKDNCIQIVCLTPVLYDCFKYLQLPPNVSFIYCRRLVPPIKKIWARNKWRKNVNKFLNRHVLYENVSKIYFTSVNSDPTMAYYIKICINKGCEVIYLNHYDDIQAIVPLKNPNIKERVKIWLFRYFIGLNLSWYRMGGRWNVIHFHYEDYSITEKRPLLDKEICKKYAYKINMGDKKAVLVFSQPNRDFDLISNKEHDHLFYKLVNTLKSKGYYVVLKGHPRLGVCQINIDQADEIIPQNISSELIDLSVFHSCYGFITIALSSAAKLGVPSYSFLPLMNDTKSQNYSDCLKFIDESGEGKIKLITSWNEI